MTEDHPLIRLIFDVVYAAQVCAYLHPYSRRRRLPTFTPSPMVRPQIPARKPPPHVPSPSHLHHAPMHSRAHFMQCA